MRLFLDGQPAFRLDSETVARNGLRVGQDLTEEEVAALAQTECHQRCLETASRYLRHKPRTEFETKSKLQQRGFPPDAIEAVITRLKDRGIVDDAAFARLWRENRQAFSPRSRWLTGLELRRKGVPAAVIDEAMRDMDDAEAAYRSAETRARRLAAADRETFRRRLGQFLKRRGFGYGVIDRTVTELWNELGGPGCMPGAPHIECSSSTRTESEVNSGNDCRLP